jgi:hypothetical protein
VTNKDLDIQIILEKVLNKEITNKKAWELLWLSKRQIIRKKNIYKKEWLKWIIHKLRWKPSNNKKDKSKYSEILKLRKEKYYDYNIIHFREKLEEKHNIKISYSTLRNLLISNWLAKYKKRKTQKQYTKRPRKDSKWEMIQYDWTYDYFFEDRNWWEEVCLLAAIDDATWEIDLRFDKSEWIIPTAIFWKEYNENHWKPRSIYIDQYATYKINHKNATDDKDLITQFWRMMQTLWIKLIFANSPQAKWRVERLNKTLQDRLIKELREANISDIDTANKFLKEVFIPKFNKQFAVKPNNNTDLHIPLSEDEKKHIKQIFSIHSTRKVKNDFTIVFKKKYYQLYRSTNGWVMVYKGDIITVEEHLDWKIYLSKNWKYLNFKEIDEKRNRVYKLPLAPINDEHYEKMKNEIEHLEKIHKIQLENETELLKTNILSYYQRTWKKHPWMKNFIIKKSH